MYITPLHIRQFCEQCIYRDRNNTDLVCSLPRCRIVKDQKSGLYYDRLTGQRVEPTEKPKEKTNG
jgi:hypothetical protein